MYRSLVLNGARSYLTIAVKVDVRQGGVMSPSLFAIFIDDVVVKFQTLGRLCIQNIFAHTYLSV